MPTIITTGYTTGHTPALTWDAENWWITTGITRATTCTDRVIITNITTCGTCVGQDDSAWASWGALPVPAPLAAPAVIHRQAQERARELFLSWLTPEQRAEFDAREIITVRSAQSGRRYELDARERAGRHGNIFELENGQRVARLCCAPRGSIPHFDAMVGQKLALELDEYDFRKEANFTPLVAGYRRVA